MFEGKETGDALRKAHASLMDDVRGLEQAVDSQQLSLLQARLPSTARHIAEHFRFEEQNGYMDAVRAREPRFERAIQNLATEHAELRKTMVGLITMAEKAESVDQNLRKGVQEWIRSLRQHEVRENDLVQDAFDIELAGED